MKKKESKEAIIAKDADQLEWILSLKEQADIGNKRGEIWIDTAYRRLKTKPAQELATTVLETDSNTWWQTNTDYNWWIDRNEKAVKKRF